MINVAGLEDLVLVHATRSLTDEPFQAGSSVDLGQQVLQS